MGSMDGKVERWIGACRGHVGREGPRSEASRRSDMGRCTVARMGMDGVEAIGVWMMACSSFAAERASERQAVGREGPRSKHRRGQARSAAVGMLAAGPMPLLCRGHDSIDSVGVGGGRRGAHRVQNGTTPGEERAASRSMGAPGLMHQDARRCRPPTSAPPLPPARSHSQAG